MRCSSAKNKKLNSSHVDRTTELTSQIFTLTNSARLLMADPICLIHLDKILIVIFMNAEYFF